MSKFIIPLWGTLVVLLASSQPLFSQVNNFEEIGKNCFEISSDKIVYDNNNHAAFTAIESFKGNLYLAFREGKGHLAEKGERVIIKILKQIDGKWIVDHEFTVPDGDLRDPFLLKWNDRLYMYSVGFYSELIESGWTPLAQIKYNAHHYLNIWKMREYKGVIYGIGNAHNKWPILLTSTDGRNWNVKEEFKLGGNATEADMCFIKNKMYICFRVEEPYGSRSYFGVGSYPFDNIKWSVMDVSVASPELIAITNRKMLLAGREYILNNNDGNMDSYISVFTINNKGEVLGRLQSLEDPSGDKGYPSFCFFNKELLMSYYSGEPNKTKIHLMKLNIK